MITNKVYIGKFLILKFAYINLSFNYFQLCNDKRNLNFANLLIVKQPSFIPER